MRSGRAQEEKPDDDDDDDENINREMNALHFEKNISVHEEISDLNPKSEEVKAVRDAEEELSVSDIALIEKDCKDNETLRGNDGMSNLEEIKLAISSSLPGLSDETLQKFIHGLSVIGVETKDDLQYVKEEDLMEFLRPIQCRKLLNAWKNEEQSSCPTIIASSSFGYIKPRIREFKFYTISFYCLLFSILRLG
ncbi:hypothetical protein cypCar_00046218 [Cyprinus carpio]|nr:hypothetical protein cypCar_00046218 [Cyprinus carpio]